MHVPADIRAGLSDADILEREQRGKWAWFQLKPGRLAEICTVIC